MKQIEINNKKVIFSKLLDFGFKKIKQEYVYQTEIMQGSFCLTVTINELGEIETVLKEPDTDEIYTLHLIDGVKGSFVGRIRCEYESVLDTILKECYEPCVFKSKQSYEIINYVRNKYGDELEYLWEKFPDNAISRRRDNKKWYLIIMTIKKNKLGFENDDKVEVINFRTNDESIFEEPNIYPGYHMNKKRWFTVILDDKTDTKTIFEYLDKSYILAKK